MKNEVFARAITEIDDELVISAHKNMVPRSKRKKWPLAVAACFLLICGIALYLGNSSRIEVFVYGNTISDQPVTIDLPAPLSSDQRLLSSDAITVPLEIKTKHKVDIKTEDGILEVYSRETDQLLCEGQTCKASDFVTVFWTIEAPNPKQIYKLHINSDTVVLLLSYSGDTNSWIVNKQ
ncbi:MAG: hypothetical protein K1W19_00700 [Lachnospiraceae bacterium]|jgi:hypothetical protein|nr:hypothetical protein [Lachnospiraceae bacterium]MCI9370985.1 hypothetical protein [Lachnospiraceae bacterium]